MDGEMMSEPMNGNSLDRNSEDKELIRFIANKMCDVLAIEYNNREIFLRLMISILEEDLLGRGKGLERHYNQKLKKLLPTIYTSFDIPANEIEINGNHDDCGKLYSIIKSIKKRYDIKDPKRDSTPKYFGKMSDSEVTEKAAPGIYGMARN